jgi:hypothetical protein
VTFRCFSNGEYQRLEKQVLVWANADMGKNVGELVPFLVHYCVLVMARNMAVMP